MWGRILLCLLILLSVVEKSTATQFAFQVTFTDKTGSLPVGNPLAFLSQRALNRRTQQGIAVNNSDVPVSPAYVDSVLTLTGGKMHLTSHWLNMCVVLVTDSTDILALQNKPYITDIKLVGRYAGQLHKSSQKHATIAAAKTTQTTDDATYYSGSYAQTVMVNGNYLHNQGYKGQGKLIAVIDAGFTNADNDAAFDSLRQSGRLVDAHNFTLDTIYVYGYDTHGAFVLSTMAGYNPGTYVGTAPLAQYALYVTEDNNSEQPIELDNMLAAMERADSLGADVITTSLGYNDFGNGFANFNFTTDFDGKTTVAAKAANIATGKGILVVASAGNEGTTSWQRVLTPGDADSALTVGSVDGTGTPAATSGYGPNAAGQIKPDVCDLGQPASLYAGGSVFNDNGTSFSTPQIAGWAACLWQSMPTATPAALRLAINRSANHYSSPQQQLGYGIPNFLLAFDYLDVKDTPTPSGTFQVSVSPNPFHDKMTVAITIGATQQVSFVVTDASGKTISTANDTFYKGISKAGISIPTTLPAGAYFLKAVGATGRSVVKLLKK